MTRWRKIRTLRWLFDEVATGSRMLNTPSPIPKLPDTLGGLAKQRFRWSFGTLQCMWKHRDAFLRPRYGTLGLIAMPNVWIFQLVFAAISPLADLMFVWSLVSVWLTWVAHGATYAVTNLEQLLTFYAVFLFVDWIAAVIAFYMEPGEDRRLTWLILLQPICVSTGHVLGCRTVVCRRFPRPNRGLGKARTQSNCGRADIMNFQATNGRAPTAALRQAGLPPVCVRLFVQTGNSRWSFPSH